MNNLLQLKGTFEQKSSPSRPGPSNLPVGNFLKVAHLEKLKNELDSLHDYWKIDQILNGALISVYYKDVVAKSRRISATFRHRTAAVNSKIVGAKFSQKGKLKHIITYYMSKEDLAETIKEYAVCIAIINNQYNGKISYDDIDMINAQKKFKEKISRTKFVQIVVDAHYVEQFSLDKGTEDFKGNAIISIYKTDIETRELMSKIGITLLAPRLLDETTMLLAPDQLLLLKQKAPYLISMGTNKAEDSKANSILSRYKAELASKLLDETTMLLTSDQLAVLKQKAPYLISMGVSDLSQLTKSDFVIQPSEDVITIPSPTNEPTIGVIDTLFDENVYFSEWVEYTKMVDSNIDESADDYVHGTAVSSIIVDGVSGNPHLDDGCGRFKVRHFGVALAGRVSSFAILRAITEIVITNRDIKVWNLSLGAVTEIHPNFISPEGAILDKIQHENDVIFVIAGTNRRPNDPEIMAIGSPADSINSLVVNAVNAQNKPASYSRRGPVLSFYTKPDAAYFGGDTKQEMSVCTPTGEAFVSGTSFAAPWIARKLSYLIDVLGLSREVAKALILHSALGWDSKPEEDALLVGHGIIPQHIDDIIRSSDDEIRFILSGVSEKHDTYTYNLPVPAYNEKHPFIAKATMCYFPSCSRSQGVDYTNTEFDFTFGRIDNNGKIKPINKKLDSNATGLLYEGDARKLFRKWDNVKHLLEFDLQKNKPRKAYGKGLWGISIKTFERLEAKHGVGLNFGLVITLKHLEGANKIEDFIQQCQLKGWLVNQIDIENKIDIHNISEEKIEFDDI